MNKLVLALLVSLLATTGTTLAGAARTLTLKWAPPTQPVIGYEVFYGKTPEAAKMRPLPVPMTLNLSAPAVQYNILRDLAALPGQNVCFRVKAFDTVTLSPFSQAVCTTL